MYAYDSLKEHIDNEIVVCSICLQTFDNPRSLPCVHTFCLKCIREYCKAKLDWLGLPIPCPHCRRQFVLPTGGVSNLPHNFVIENLIQASRSHEYCGKHDDQILKKFCTECSVQICPLCEVLSHSNHKCIPISAARERLVRRIDEEVGKVSRAQVRTTKEKERLENMTDNFRNKTLKIKEYIKSTGEEMKRLIDKDVDRLISDVQVVETETLEKLKTLTEPLNNALHKTEQLTENARLAKSHKNIKDMTDGFQKLSQTAKELLECDILTSTFQPPETSFVPNSNLADILGSSRVGDFTVTQSAVKRKHDEVTTPDVVASHKKFPVSFVVRQLPEEVDIEGVAILNDKFYVLRPKYLNQIEEYDSIFYKLIRRFPGPSLNDSVIDMTACEHNRCLYISDLDEQCVYRLDVERTSTKSKWLVDYETWYVDEEPFGLSVTGDHNVLVTCTASKRLMEFTKDGDFVNEINLPSTVDSPWHAVKLTGGQFAVCHGSSGVMNVAPLHRVCIVDCYGNMIHFYGGQRGSSPGQLNLPCRLATDKDGYIFVLDEKNRRIIMLSPTLQFAGDVVTRGQLDGRPSSMCFDVRRRRLHVAANKSEDHSCTSGRIVVFRV